MSGVSSQKAFTAQLKKVYTWYTGGFIAFVLGLAVLEQLGMPARDRAAVCGHWCDEPHL
jgi:hypothetical protein